MTASLLRPVCFAALVALSSPSAAAENEFSRFNRQGEQAYQEGQYALAAELLIQAHAINPVPALLFNIARAHQRAGNSEQAIRFYQRYLDAQGTDLETVKKAARAIDQLRTEQSEASALQAKKEADERELATKAQAERDARAKEQAERDRPVEPLVTKLASPPVSVERPSWVPSVAVFAVAGAALLAGVALGVSAQNEAKAFQTQFDPVLRPSLKASAMGRALGADICFGVSLVSAGVATFLTLRMVSSSPPRQTLVVPVAFHQGAGAAWVMSW